MLHNIKTIKLSLDEPTRKELHQRYIAIDTETTGLSKYNDRLVEIGAVIFEDGDPIDSFQTLINPRMHIPGCSTCVHGISDEMVKDAPFEEEAIRMFIDYISSAFDEKTVFVGHNFSFDLGFLDEAFARSGLICDLRYIDTMYVTRKHFYLPNYRQTTVAEHLNIPTEGSHRADKDALICGEILSYLLDYLD